MQGGVKRAGTACSGPESWVMLISCPIYVTSMSCAATPGSLDDARLHYTTQRHMTQQSAITGYMYARGSLVDIRLNCIIAARSSFNMKSCPANPFSLVEDSGIREHAHEAV